MVSKDCQIFAKITQEVWKISTFMYQDYWRLQKNTQNISIDFPLLMEGLQNK